MGVGRPIGVGSSLAVPMVVEGRRWGRSCGRRQALTQACAGVGAGGWRSAEVACGGGAAGAAGAYTGLCGRWRA